jgi:phosphatidylglycerol:prolipoprotein diacylglycerol transferase
VSFILIYQFWVKKFYPNNSLLDLLPIAPPCITVAHGFGRIGCFLAGCCYGKVTDSIFGVTFPGMTHAVYPTQLFEALF